MKSVPLRPLMRPFPTGVFPRRAYSWPPALAVIAFSLAAYGQTRSNQASSNQAGSSQSSVVVADFSNPGISPAHWTLTLHPDGTGRFHSEPGKPSSSESTEIDAPAIDRDVQLSKDYAQHVFRIARQHKWFNQKCESHLKVAFQGWKKLSYDGPDGHGACTFNFSQDKDIEALGDSLVGVAETLREGARLEMLLQHDRLGLDKEMEYIADGAKDGRMQQIGAIKGILERLAGDDEVLERVRKRAQLLLASAGP